MGTADALKKLNHEQRLTLGEYGNIINSRRNEYKSEYMFKLQGYLTALKDLKIITESEKRCLYLYFNDRKGE